MKKYKAYWSLFNLLSATQEEVVKLQMIWTGISGIVLSSTFVVSSDRITLVSALVCAVVDKVILNCFSFEIIEPKKENDDVKPN